MTDKEYTPRDAAVELAAVMNTVRDEEGQHYFIVVGRHDDGSVSLGTVDASTV